MRLLPYLLSFYLPLCGTLGATGIAPPGVVDFLHLKRLGHSEVFLAPPGFAPLPDLVAPVYHLPPQKLFELFQAIAAAQPRTFALDREPAALQAAWVVRSAAGNFPDIVEMAAIPEPGGSSVVLYSHAIYGWSDYGVNRNRAKKWMELLDMKVAE
jgi:uncharacterized protein (DUF1499 family)